MDTNRIIAKKIILTGYPFKIHRKSAVIRYMFFNPDDINWFKPIQLTTKYGHVGHIRESIGKFVNNLLNIYNNLIYIYFYIN